MLITFCRALQIVNLQSNPVTSHQKYRGFMQQILPALEHLDNISLHRRDRHQPVYDYSSQYVQRQTHPNRPYLLWSETAARWGALEHHAPPPPPPVIVEEPSPLPWRRPPDVTPRPWKGKPLLESCKKAPPPAANKASRRQSISTTATSETITHPSDWDKYSRPNSPPRRKAAPGTGKRSSDTTIISEALPSTAPSSPPSPYKYKVTLGTSPRSSKTKQRQRLFHPTPQSLQRLDVFERSSSNFSDSPERVSSLEAAPPILASPTLRDRMMLRQGSNLSSNDDLAVKNLLSEYQNLSVADLNRPLPPPLPCDTFMSYGNEAYEYASDDDEQSLGEYSHASRSTIASNQPSIADDVRSVALHIFYEQKKETLSQLKHRRKSEQTNS